MDKIRILYLDDEEANRNAFIAHFRRNKKYIVTVRPLEGIEHTLDENRSFDIVLFDQVNSELVDKKILGHFNEGFFKPIFIVTTSQSDVRVLESAQKEKLIFKFHSKPYMIDELEKSIHNAHLQYVLNAMEVKLWLMHSNMISKGSVQTVEVGNCLIECMNELKRLQSLINIQSGKDN